MGSPAVYHKAVDRVGVCTWRAHVERTETRRTHVQRATPTLSTLVSPCRNAGPRFPDTLGFFFLRVGENLANRFRTNHERHVWHMTHQSAGSCWPRSDPGTGSVGITGSPAEMQTFALHPGLAQNLHFCQGRC